MIVIEGKEASKERLEDAGYMEKYVDGLDKGGYNSSDENSDTEHSSDDSDDNKQDKNDEERKREQRQSP